MQLQVKYFYSMQCSSIAIAKARIDDFFTTALTTDFPIYEQPASAFRNIVETFYERNNFAITEYKMPRDYIYILTPAR